jgi:hypothetical protein
MVVRVLSIMILTFSIFPFTSTWMANFTLLARRAICFNVELALDLDSTGPFQGISDFMLTGIQQCQYSMAYEGDGRWRLHVRFSAGRYAYRL